MRMLKSKSKPEWQAKAIVITGGSRGIGFAAARAFLEGGGRVAICARDGARLESAERELGMTGPVLSSVANVCDPEQVTGFIKRVEDSFGPIDVLVNNAGILYAGPFVQESHESIGDVIDVNLKGLMYMARAVLPSMIARGKGVIINVSSGAGLSGFADIVSYCASKFGVVGFTESLAQEVGPLGVRVAGLCPGRVATDMQVQYSGERIGLAPERVAERIIELARPESRVRTGTCVTIR
jgi:3-oxoacyl-[acyl-carrier protein] reductase